MDGGILKKYVAFDVDGTLNRTDLYAVEAYQKALAKRGRKAERDEIISLIGMSPMAIIERLFGSLEAEDLDFWRADIKQYEFELMKKASTFEGIEDVLMSLKKDGYGLAICSNAFLGHIQNVLRTIGIWEYFDEIGSLEIGMDKSEILSKLIEKLEPDRICMVGDRVFDVRAAEDNRVPMIGCAYGYAPWEVKGADIIVETPADLLDAVKKLI